MICMLSFALASLLLLGSTPKYAYATPAPASPSFVHSRDTDIVISPIVTSPNASTVWTTKSSQVVTWNTDMIPENSRNATGLLMLGFLKNGSENLQYEHPLAQNFLISAGSQAVTVPDVPTMSNYIVVLFGDSGNASPQFTIRQTD